MRLGVITAVLLVFGCHVCRYGSAATVPGYLDFDNLPETNFSCEGKVIGGYYADVETGCQMFHVCTIGQKGETTDIKFLCLNGTVFDQETRVCERVDEVDCSKTEGFYDLNLELYGNTGATYGQETPEDEDDKVEDPEESPTAHGGPEVQGPPMGISSTPPPPPPTTRTTAAPTTPTTVLTTPPPPPPPPPPSTSPAPPNPFTPPPTTVSSTLRPFNQKPVHFSSTPSPHPFLRFPTNRDQIFGTAPEGNNSPGSDASLEHIPPPSTSQWPQVNLQSGGGSGIIHQTDPGSYHAQKTTPKPFYGSTVHNSDHSHHQVFFSSTKPPSHFFSAKAPGGYSVTSHPPVTQYPHRNPSLIQTNIPPDFYQEQHNRNQQNSNHAYLRHQTNLHAVSNPLQFQFQNSPSRHQIFTTPAVQSTVISTTRSVTRVKTTVKQPESEDTEDPPPNVNSFAFGINSGLSPESNETKSGENDPTPPTTYDEYHERDVVLDPFFKDVPRIHKQGRRKRRTKRHAQELFQRTRGSQRFRNLQMLEVAEQPTADNDQLETDPRQTAPVTSKSENSQNTRLYSQRPVAQSRQGLQFSQRNANTNAQRVPQSQPATDSRQLSPDARQVLPFAPRNENPVVPQAPVGRVQEPQGLDDGSRRTSPRRRQRPVSAQTPVRIQHTEESQVHVVPANVPRSRQRQKSIPSTTNRASVSEINTEIPTTSTIASTTTRKPLPETNFSCNGKVVGGYYADPEVDCQLFHICVLGRHGRVRDDKFLCGPGTRFDQKSRTCQAKHLVDCSLSTSLYYVNTQHLFPEDSEPVPKLSFESHKITKRATSKGTAHTLHDGSHVGDLIDEPFETDFTCADKPQEGLYADVQTDCKYFHLCQKSKKGPLHLSSTFMCPPGTSFNQFENNCDLSKEIDCELYSRPEHSFSRSTKRRKRQVKSSAETSHRVSKFHPGRAQQEANEARRTGDLVNVLPETDFSCSDKADEGLYADVETNCKYFHLCQKGKSGQMYLSSTFMCPSGTSFNQREGNCDLTKEIDCDLYSKPEHSFNRSKRRNKRKASHISAIDKIQIHDKKDRIRRAGNERRKTGDTADDPPETGFSCADKPKEGFYADIETDCEYFHLCQKSKSGKLHLASTFVCPPGTSFNQFEGNCDTSEEIDCELYSRPEHTFSRSKSRSKREIITTTDEFNENLSKTHPQQRTKIQRDVKTGHKAGDLVDKPPETDFTCEGKPQEGLYADVETNCEYFHLCQKQKSGKLYLSSSFICPPGTIFNQFKRNCDTANETDCENTISRTKREAVRNRIKLKSIYAPRSLLRERKRRAEKEEAEEEYYEDEELVSEEERHRERLSEETYSEDETVDESYEDSQVDTSTHSREDSSFADSQQEFSQENVKDSEQIPLKHKQINEDSNKHTETRMLKERMENNFPKERPYMPADNEPILHETEERKGEQTSDEVQENEREETKSEELTETTLKQGTQNRFLKQKVKEEGDKSEDVDKSAFESSEDHSDGVLSRETEAHQKEKEITLEKEESEEHHTIKTVPEQIQVGTTENTSRKWPTQKNTPVIKEDDTEKTADGKDTNKTSEDSLSQRIPVKALKSKVNELLVKLNASTEDISSLATSNFTEEEYFYYDDNDYYYPDEESLRELEEIRERLLSTNEKIHSTKGPDLTMENLPSQIERREEVLSGDVVAQRYNGSLTTERHSLLTEKPSDSFLADATSSYESKNTDDVSYMTTDALKGYVTTEELDTIPGTITVHDMKIKKENTHVKEIMKLEIEEGSNEILNDTQVDTETLSIIALLVETTPTSIGHITEPVDHMTTVLDAAPVHKVSTMPSVIRVTVEEKNLLEPTTNPSPHFSSTVKAASPDNPDLQDGITEIQTTNTPEEMSSLTTTSTTTTASSLLHPYRSRPVYRTWRTTTPPAPVSIRPKDTLRRPPKRPTKGRQPPEYIQVKFTENTRSREKTDNNNQTAVSTTEEHRRKENTTTEMLTTAAAAATTTSVAPNFPVTTVNIDLMVQETTVPHEVSYTKLPPHSVHKEVSTEAIGRTESYLSTAEKKGTNDGMTPSSVLPTFSRKKFYIDKGEHKVTLPGLTTQDSISDIRTTTPPDLEGTTSPSSSYSFASVQAQTSPLHDHSVVGSKDSSFSCIGKELHTYLPDPRDCHLFHYCSPGFHSRQVLDFRFMCDKGTAFSGVSRRCEEEESILCGTLHS